jgi:DNA-3-methyladenine glycosylase II
LTIAAHINLIRQIRFDFLLLNKFKKEIYMTDSNHFKLHYTGEYSLADSVSLAAGASFVENLRDDGFLDLAFPLEGSWKTVGVRVNQPEVEINVDVFANPGNAATDDIRAQLKRILSLDVDAADFAEITDRDPVVAKLRKRHPGLRPVLFPSPYEAAARAIIGHQLPVKQAAAITARIAEDNGVRVETDDHSMHAFPAPDKLADLPLVKGLAARKIEQLCALGAATGDWLDSVQLRTLNRDEAIERLQELAGIGPFSAELILMRGAGDADAFPYTEKRLHQAMATAYELGNDPSINVLEKIAERWRPFRNWVGLLLRNFIN